MRWSLRKIVQAGDNSWQKQFAKSRQKYRPSLTLERQQENSCCLQEPFVRPCVQKAVCPDGLWHRSPKQLFNVWKKDLVVSSPWTYWVKWRQNLEEIFWEVVLEAGIEFYAPDSGLVIGVVVIGFHFKLCNSSSVYFWTSPYLSHLYSISQ